MEGDFLAFSHNCSLIESTAEMSGIHQGISKAPCVLSLAHTGYQPGTFVDREGGEEGNWRRIMGVGCGEHTCNLWKSSYSHLAPKLLASTFDDSTSTKKVSLAFLGKMNCEFPHLNMLSHGFTLDLNFVCKYLLLRTYMFFKQCSLYVKDRKSVV